MLYKPSDFIGVENAGYTIIDATQVAANEWVVLVRSDTNRAAPFVVWQACSPTDFFWGHYFQLEDHAKLDFYRTAYNLAESLYRDCI